MAWLTLLYDVVTEIKLLVVVWLVSILLASFTYRAFTPPKDNLYWLLLPVAVATFIITPLIYLLARPESLF